RRQPVVADRDHARRLLADVVEVAAAERRHARLRGLAAGGRRAARWRRLTALIPPAISISKEAQARLDHLFRPDLAEGVGNLHPRSRDEILFDVEMRQPNRHWIVAVVAQRARRADAAGRRTPAADKG